MKLNVGGEGKRGGLLVEDTGGYNALQILISMPGDGDRADDSVCLDALNRLVESDLLKKEDIREYNLLCHACHPSAKERFEYLVDWDPEALKKYDYEGNSLLHATACVKIGSFAMALKAGMQYYPEELGFLFQKNSAGKTACEMASELLGKGEAWRVIDKCFEETHNVKIVELNPMTNMFPFILAAADDTSDLNTLYYLLWRSPIVLDGVGQEQVVDDCASIVEMKRRRLS